MSEAVLELAYDAAREQFLAMRSSNYFDYARAVVRALAGAGYLKDDDDRQALGDFAEIMSGFERREVEESAVSTWRCNELAFTRRIIDAYLPEELREDYERARREYEGEDG